MAATLPATPYNVSEKMERSEPSGRGPQRRRAAPWMDTLFSVLAHGAAWLTLALLAGILGSLFISASPAIREYGLSFLWTSEWDPVQDKYGGLVMIYGTLMTSFIALLIAVPVSFGIALFLTELSPQWLRRPLGTWWNCSPPCRPSSTACGVCWFSHRCCRNGCSSRCKRPSAGCR